MPRDRRLFLILALTLATLCAGGSESDNDDFEVHLWPLVQHSRLPDGKHRTLLLFFYHRTANADGSTYSYNVLNYLQAPEFSAVLPLFYRVGRASRRHTMLVPLWFQGPGYTVAPLLLSGGWKRDGGGRALWVTPLFHLGTAADGSVHDLHLLTYFHSRRSAVLAPLAYYGGDPGRKHLGIIPVLFAGPGYWVVPPALSGSWRTDHGTTTWITPLFHLRRDREGSLASMHLLTWFHGRDDDVVFPLLWRSNKRLWIVPLWFQGPRGWLSPPLLSAHWRNAERGSSTWVTPLFHASTDASGELASFHALNYFHSRDWNVLFPLVWVHGRPGQRSGCVLPLYFHSTSTDVVLPFFYRHRRADGGMDLGLIPLWLQGKDWWCSPPLLSSWKRNADGGATTWVTPLFHLRRDREGSITSLHALNYFAARDRQLLLPLAYRVGPPGHRHVGVVPLYFSGPNAWAAPLALSGGWKRAHGGTSTWITPLFHLDRDRAGKLERFHLLAYAHGRHHDVLFPLWWRFGEQGRRSTWLLPLWLSGPDYKVSPALLSVWHRRDDGGSATWLTPLFHRGTDAAGKTTDWHALNVIHAGDTDVILPLAWRTGPAGRRSGGVFPLYFHGPRHLVVAPLFYRFERGDQRYVGVLPLFCASRRSWVAPLLLSGSWRDRAGRRTTLVTPLFHRTTDGGRLVHQHLLTYVATPTLSTVFPIAWSWRTAAGGRRTMLLPLAYQHERADGDYTATFLPALFSYHSGARLDTSVPYQLFPFIVQRAKDGSEFNLLWRLLHLRRQQRTTELTVGPLWWSEHHRSAPARWQVLGGLAGRDCNYRTGTSRAYALWILPLGQRRHFAVDTATPPTALEAPRS